jgi:hypothetical protein
VRTKNKLNFPTPSCAKDEVPNIKTEDLIMCCVIREIAHFSEAVVDQYGVMVE